MTMHFLERQRLQNFLGLYKKGGVERAEVLHKMVRLLEPINSGRLADTLPAFETAFHKCFVQFHSSNNPLKNRQLAAAKALLKKTLASSTSKDRLIWESVADYLLTTLPRHKTEDTSDQKASLSSVA